MRIAALQSEIVWENPDANFEGLRAWTAAAAAAGARFLILPETYACGFSMNTAVVGEPVGGPSTRFLQEEAAKHGLWVAGSVPERQAEGERPYNTLIVAGPDGEVRYRYRKIHPFSYAGESEHYGAGEEFVTAEIEGIRFTFFICYDLRFADEFWVKAPDTDAYVVVANWPEPRRRHWQVLLEARAIENQAYVVGVNRVGEGGGLRYQGDSRIISPMGDILAGASGQETLLLGEIDPAVVAETRRTLPFMQDRRSTADTLRS